MNLRKAVLLLAAVSLLLSGVGMVQADDHDERPSCADRYTPASHEGQIFDQTDNCAHEKEGIEKQEGNAPETTGGP